MFEKIKIIFYYHNNKNNDNNKKNIIHMLHGTVHQILNIKRSSNQIYLKSYDLIKYLLF